MVKMLVRYYRRLPDDVKRFISPFKLPFKIWRELRFDVYMLSGEMKMLYITSSRIDPYFIEKTCGDASVTRIKGIYAWELRKFIDQQDAVLIDMHRSFTRFFNDAFLVPHFVRQVLDLDRPVDELVERRDLRKIGKYRCEVATDLDALRLFYEKMYVPYLKNRFADSALIDSFNKLKKILENGELLFVKLEDR